MAVKQNTKVITEKKDNNKKEKGKFLSVLQNIGKSLVFPIAVLPAAAILLRVGVAISDVGVVDGTGVEQFVYWLGWILYTPADVIFANLPLIFAVGVAFGFAKDNRGEAALVGAIMYLGLIGISQVEGSFASLIYGNVNTFEYEGESYSRILYLASELESGGFTEPQWMLNLGAFGGILSGLIAAVLYNRYSEVRLPAALGFFSGRRFVPMLAMVAAAVVGIMMAVIWPWIQYGLVEVSKLLVKAPEVAAGAYAFANRLLIPFGLHQVLNVFFWFQMPIVAEGTQLFIQTETVGEFIPLLGDITAFLGSTNNVVLSIDGGATSVSGQEAFDLLQAANVGTFQTGYFPIMMFGLPAIGFAIIKNSDKESRKSTMTFIMSAAAVAFLTGITEPLEFGFMFVSPILYFAYALLSGVVASLTVLTGASFGFGFSAGAIDLFLSLQISTNLAQGFSSSLNGYMGLISILGMGVIVAPVYYLMADVIIRMTNPETTGRTPIKKFKRPTFVEAIKGTFKTS